MRCAAFIAVVLLCACPPPGGNDGGAGGGAGGSGGSGGSGGAGGDGAPRPERWVVANDGTAVLWLRDGGAPADVAVTVTRDDAGFIFAPDGLQLGVPAILFVPTAGPPLEPDAGGMQSVQGEVASSDGGIQLVRTARAAVVGNGGRQFGLTALEVPHFSRGSLSVGGAAFTLEVKQDGRDHFRKDHQQEFIAKVTALPVIPNPAQPSYTITVEAKGSVSLLDATLTSPGRSSGSGGSAALDV